jgi:hypothetical protein
MKTEFETQRELALPRLFYSAEEVRQMLGLKSTKTVYRLCQRNLLRRSNAVRTLLISRESLERFQANTTQ